MTKKSRYPGIRSFEPNERKQFFGRKRETRELHELIQAERFIVLFAKSGIGKTSLLNAGVMPLLKQDVYYPVRIRFQGTGEKGKAAPKPAETLKQSIDALAEQFWIKEKGQKRLAENVKGRQPLLWEHLKAYNFQKEVAITPVLILDQFEEFFLHEEADQKEFVDCLADLIYERVPKSLLAQAETTSKPQEDFFATDFSKSSTKTDWHEPIDWKIVIAIRSDRLSLLDHLSEQIPAILKNRYQLYPFKREQATDAIVSPAQLDGEEYAVDQFDYSSEALELIIDKLSNRNGEIEAFQLQIICQHIEQKIKEEEATDTVNPKLLGGKEGIKDILEGYYRRKIDSLGTEEEQLAARELIEEGLIVGSARVGLAEGSIFQQYGISEDLLNRILETRILRRENTHLGTVYEVAHDTLVDPILNSYEERRKAEEKEQQRREKAERERELAEQRKKLEKEQARRRRANRLTVVSVIFAVLSIITSVWAYAESQEAKEARKEVQVQLQRANELKTEAEQNLQKAKENLQAFYEEQLSRLYNELPIYKNAGQCNMVDELANKATELANKLLNEYSLDATKKDFYENKLEEVKRLQKACQ